MGISYNALSQLHNSHIVLHSHSYPLYTSFAYDVQTY